MSGRLGLAGFGVLALAGTLGMWGAFGLPIALGTMAVLMRGWSQAAELPGQGAATLLMAGGATSFGLGWLFGGDGGAEAPSVLAAVGDLAAVVLSMAACGRLAAARGRSPGWALAGLATIVGFGVLVFLPPLTSGAGPRPSS